MSAGDRAVLRVVLDLVLDAEPITGTLRGADGAAHDFCGWIELTQALDAVRRAAGHPS